MTVSIEENRCLVRIRSDEIVLAEYVVEPRMPESDSPKPYLHPLRTTGGQVVTAVRPHDHSWHNGLQFTMALLSGENFWGGRTYVRDRGYVPLDNNGTVSHLRWERLDCSGDRAVLTHELAWLTASGEKWMSERRTIGIGGVDHDRGCWTLSWTSRIRNTSGRKLRWGSPVTEGRPTAGYGGLFWRGPRSFTGGVVRTPDGAREAMGHRAPWLAFTGRHDESLGSSTLLFVDSLANQGHPTPWYVRAEPFPVVSFAATYHRERLLAPEEELALTHHIVLIDGVPGVDELGAYAAALAGTENE